MNTIGDIVTAYATTLAGIGWGLYLLGSAVVVGGTLAIEHVRTKGTAGAALPVKGQSDA